MKQPLEKWLYDGIDAITKSVCLRAFMMALLTLILMIPIQMIDGVIRQRQATRSEAQNDVTSSWGGQQHLRGPWISIPYTHRWLETFQRGGQTETLSREEKRWATFLPESLHTDGDVNNEIRKRGIYQVPLYTGTFRVSGSFNKPDLGQWGVSPEDIHWDEATLSLALSDAKGIVQQTSIRWQDETLPLIPGLASHPSEGSGIHAKLGNPLQEPTYTFSMVLHLRGSQALTFSPMGKDTQLELRSNWPDPSFQGGWLPVHYEGTEEGFQASWTIPYLSRNLAQQWPQESAMLEAIHSISYGMTFLPPIDPYRMGLRSVKYALLFISLSYLVFWLMEVLHPTRIHPVQYLLIGAGICLFYLLELSLAEHVGFFIAYSAASMCITLMVGLYTWSVLKSLPKAWTISGVLCGLYGSLYIVLKSQDHALLIGSIGLVVALGSTMYLTRGMHRRAPCFPTQPTT
jgi:inner membrane protein